MGLGVSIFLIAVGAILTFGINVDTDNSGIFNIDVIGIILMIIGAIGILLSLLFFNRGTTYGRGADRTVVHERDRDVV